MSRWAFVLFAYLGVGILGAGAAQVAWGSPFLHPTPWLRLGPLATHALSLSLGAAFGLAVALASGPLVRHVRAARLLAEELAPVARSIPSEMRLPLAVLSSLGEEFLFRSALMPWVGLVPASLLFGLSHQMRGPGRWPWVISATVMGLCLGALYQALGSLLGPIVAHAIINSMNLRMLREREVPTATRTPLGGVLGSSLPR